MAYSPLLGPPALFLPFVFILINTILLFIWLHTVDNRLSKHQSFYVKKSQILNLNDQMLVDVYLFKVYFNLFTDRIDAATYEESSLQGVIANLFIYVI